MGEKDKRWQIWCCKLCFTKHSETEGRAVETEGDVKEVMES